MKTKIMYWMVIVFLVYSVSAVDEGIKTACVYETNGPHMKVVKAADLDNDGIPEIFAGSSNGVVYNLKLKDCEEQWTATWQFIGMEDEITDLQIMDFDRDGEKDVLVTSLDRNKYFYVLGLDNTKKYKPKEALDSIYSMDVGDFDADGINEILLAGKHGKIYLLEQTESRWNLKLGIKWTAELDNPAYYVKAVNIDADPEMEIIALTNDQGKTATVYVLSSNGKTEWSYEIDKGVYQANDYSISISDIDGNGGKEILVAAYDNKLIALSNQGSEIWSYKTERLVSSVRVDDLENDGSKEIIFGSYPKLYVLDSDGVKKWDTETDSTILSIEIADLNKDNIKEIITGSVKSIQVFGSDGENLAGWVYAVLDKQKEINARMIGIGDFDSDGSVEIASGFGWQEAMLDHNYDQGELRVFDVDIPTGSTTTTSITTTTTTTLEPTTSTLKTTTSLKPVSSTMPTTTTTPAEESGGIDLMLLLIIGVVLLVLLVLAVVAVVVLLKLRSGKKEKESGKTEKKPSAELSKKPAAKPPEKNGKKPGKNEKEPVEVDKVLDDVEKALDEMKDNGEI
ncbi:MAG: hypothetical protein U9M95_04880 [Candidatus Altiarchaeota archaeon]|nr:hypothetical protein [Candidatus Altiarchaeota archaeon]